MMTFRSDSDPSESWVVENGAYASDGGSIALQVRTPTGTAYSITLWQHLFTDVDDPARRPGRLYVDKALVAVRSEQEQELIAALREARIVGGEPAAKEDRLPTSPGMIVGQDLQDYHAKIEEGPAAALAYLVQQLIAYVESDDYVELARRLSGTL